MDAETLANRLADLLTEDDDTLAVDEVTDENRIDRRRFAKPIRVVSPLDQALSDLLEQISEYAEFVAAEDVARTIVGEESS